MARSYTTNSSGGGVQPKAFRPKTLAEAKRLIAETFAKQGRDGWSTRDIKVYFENKGIAARSANDLSLEQARIVIDAMARSKMVIFHGDTS